MGDSLIRKDYTSAICTLVSLLVIHTQDTKSASYDYRLYFSLVMCNTNSSILCQATVHLICIWEVDCSHFLPTPATLAGFVW